MDVDLDGDGDGDVSVIDIAQSPTAAFMSPSPSTLTTTTSPEGGLCFSSSSPTSPPLMKPAAAAIHRPMRPRFAPALLLIAAGACLHARGDSAAGGAVRRVPLRVAPDVLAAPARFASAQPLGEALRLLLGRRGFCLDRRGDFEAVLQLALASDAEGLKLTLTVDKATGVRLDEIEERLGGALPHDAGAAQRAVAPLVEALEASAAMRELAESSGGCRDCCEPGAYGIDSNVSSSR